MNDVEGPGPDDPHHIYPEETGGTTPPVPTTVEPPMSLPARLAGVLLSPGRTFRRILAHPAWAGALGVYLAATLLAALVYSAKVDWEGMMRAQFEDSVAFKMMSGLMSDEEMDAIEKASLREIDNLGSGGMTLQTTLQTVVGGAVGFQVMGILFATLFYLMGSLADLRLGRVYLDGLISILVICAFLILGIMVRITFGEDTRSALPFQAGLNAILFLALLWLLRRSIERQAAFRKLMSVYAHGLAVSTVAALLIVVVVLLRSEPLTAGIDQVIQSNLGALTGAKDSTFLGVLLSSLDLFRLWQLVVLSIGFAALTGLSIGTSAAITFLPWGFVTMVRAALAAVFGG